MLYAGLRRPKELNIRVGNARDVRRGESERGTSPHWSADAVPVPPIKPAMPSPSAHGANGRD